MQNILDLGAIPNLLSPSACAANTAAFQAAANKGGLIYVPAGAYYKTGTVYFKSNTHFCGEWQGSTAIIETLPVPAFQALTQRDRDSEFPFGAMPGKATTEVKFSGFNLNNLNSGRPAGSMGIDARNVSNLEVASCTFRYHEYGVWGGQLVTQKLAGYYLDFLNCKFHSCEYGVYGDSAFNGFQIRGGNSRFQGCVQAGVRILSSSGGTMCSVWERCGIGAWLGSNCWNCIVSGHFERNGRDASDHYIPGKGAVVIEEGSWYHLIDAGTDLSGGSDLVLDKGKRSVCHVIRMPAGCDIRSPYVWPWEVVPSALGTQRIGPVADVPFHASDTPWPLFGEQEWKDTSC